MKNVIYKIGNTVNEKIYIGSTEKFSIRKNQHNHHLKKGTHHSAILQRHVNKYGFDSIYFEIIESGVINLIEREQFYIDTLNPYFNIRRIAESMKGTKRNDEQKIYMVKQRNLKSPYKKGWNHSEETIAKIKATRMKNGGWIVTEEAKLKMSISSKSYKPTKETIEKIKASKKGAKLTDSHKDNLSKTKKGSLNPMYNKKKELHHNFGKKWKLKEKRIKKKVIDTITGIVYEDIDKASLELNIPQSTLNKYILGYNKKITNFKYYE